MLQRVELFLTDARALAGREPECLPLLTPERRAEAVRYRNESDRLLHCAAGLLLRRVLGVKDDSQLHLGAWGKPELSAGGPRFSLSHSGHCAVLAVSADTVGADVEPLRRPDILPRKMLTAEETDWLSLHTSPEDFCLLWTRLESALKAEGCGLAAEKRDFSLLRCGEPWHWESRVRDGCLVTCAALNPMALEVSALTAAELLESVGV